MSSAEDRIRTSQNVDRLAPEPVAEPIHVAVATKRCLMAADSAAVLSGFLMAFIAQAVFRRVPTSIAESHGVLMMISIPGFAFGAGLTKLHQARANERLSQELANIVGTVAIGVATMVTAAFALQFKDLSRFWILLVIVCVTGALIAERRIARRVFAAMRAEGKLTRRIVIVGTDAHAIGLLHTYQRKPELGYRVVGFVGDDNIGPRGGVSVLGGLDELRQILYDHDAVGVVVSLSSIDDTQVNVLTRRLTDAGYHVALSTALADIDVSRLRAQQIDGRTMMYVEPIIRNGWRAIAKRAFDMASAAAILVLSTPIWLAAVVAIKIDSRGPALFRQQRVGRDGALFTMTKLRTMVVDAEARKAELVDQNEADGALFKIHDDPRITRVGKVLRKLSIDELPQLLSVIFGTMSMVGPRPALPDEVAKWDETLCERLRVMPGLTGMWQISGRSDSNFHEYRRLDLYYVDNWSLVHDLRICAKTIGVVLTGRGAA